jgi:hypothetical protein
MTGLGFSVTQHGDKRTRPETAATHHDNLTFGRPSSHSFSSASSATDTLTPRPPRIAAYLSGKDPFV